MVYELPPSLNIDSQPFLEMVGKIQAEIQKTLSWSLPVSDRELLTGVSKNLDQQLAEFNALVPATIQQAEARYQQTRSDFVQLQVDQAAHAKRAEEVLAEMRADIEKSKLAAEAEKAKPKFFPLRPRKRAEKAPDVLPLAPGQELCDLLSHLSPLAPPEVSQPTRVSGNIWENWGPMGLPPTHLDGETPPPEGETPLLDELHENSSPWS